MTDDVEIIVFSPVYDKSSSAEVWISGELWAILSGYDLQDPQIEFYARANKLPFKLAHKGVDKILQKAYGKLYNEVDCELMERLLAHNSED